MLNSLDMGNYGDWQKQTHYNGPKHFHREKRAAVSEMISNQKCTQIQTKWQRKHAANENNVLQIKKQCKFRKTQIPPKMQQENAACPVNTTDIPEASEGNAKCAK